MAISNNSTGLRPGVCTSTTRPTAPYEGQMIYETDTDLMLVWSGSAWVEINSALTKAPRGVMGYAKSTVDQTLSTAITDVTAMSVTFTAVANRLYRATFEGFYSMNTNSQNQFIITNASNVQEDMTFQDTGGGQFTTICFQYLFTATAGSKTLKVRALTSAGNMIIYGATGAFRSYSFVIEDIGAA